MLYRPRQVFSTKQYSHVGYVRTVTTEVERHSGVRAQIQDVLRSEVGDRSQVLRDMCVYKFYKTDIGDEFH